MLPRTIPELLSSHARQFPERIALIDPMADRRWSFQELERASRCAASFLKNQGLRSGDRLALALPNGSAGLLLVLGSLQLGVVPIPLDLSLKASELAPLLRRCGVRLLILDAAYARHLKRIGSSSKRILASPSGEASLRAVNLDFELGRCRPVRAGTWHAPDSLAVMAHTSGSTSGSKLIAVSHRSLMDRLSRSDRLLGLGPRRTYLSLLPLKFDVFYPCLTALYSGGTLVLSPVLSPSTLPGVWDSVRKHRVEVIHLVPAWIRLLLKLPPPSDHAALRTLRYCTSTAASLEPRTVRRFKAVFGLPLINGYGLKETGFLAASQLRAGAAGASLAGKPLRGEIAILAPDGSKVGAGRTGEIAFRTNPRRPGFWYHDDAALNAERFQKGWFLTGDLGRMDRRGSLFLRGRACDIINHKGLKVSAGEVEAVLLRHEAVQDAGVIGLPDSLLGERIAAGIVLRPGTAASERELLAHCRSRLADYKCPGGIRILSGIPRTALGKVRRVRLRALLRDV